MTQSVDPTLEGESADKKLSRASDAHKNEEIIPFFSSGVIFFLIPMMFLVVYLLPLNVRPLLEPDETRYAEIPREMVSSNDWIVPRLNGLRYFEKPVLGYWLNAISFKAFGESNFTVRLPSALSVGLTTLFLFFLARKELGVKVALLASAIYLTFTEVYAVGTITVLDSFLCLFITAALVFWYYHTIASGRDRSRYLLLFGVACGCAFLVKGFVAFVLPGLILGAFYIGKGRWRTLSVRMIVLPIIAILVVVLPWSLAIHQLEPGFWHKFFWIEHVERFSGAGKDQHPEVFWFFIPGLLGGALPWSVLFPASFYGLKQVYQDTPLYSYLLLWILLPLLFFSASTGKLFSYILPCFPPLAILIAAGLFRYLQKPGTKLMDRGSVLLAVIFAGIALVLFSMFFNDTLNVYPGETGKLLLAVAAVAAYSLLLVQSARVKKKSVKLGIFAIASVPLLLANPFLFPQDFLEEKAPEALFERNRDRIGPETLLVSHEDPLRAVCWYYKRDDVYIFANPTEFRYGLSYEDARHRGLANFGQTDVSPFQFLDFVAEHGEQTNIVLILPTHRYQLFSDANLLPEPVFVDRGNRYFVLAEYGNRKLVSFKD